MALMPPLPASARQWSRMGSRNDSVLPEPMSVATSVLRLRRVKRRGELGDGGGVGAGGARGLEGNVRALEHGTGVARKASMTRSRPGVVEAKEKRRK